MRRYTKFFAGGAVAVALMIPAGAAFAQADDPTQPVCTGDQRQEQIHQQLHDGSQDGQMLQHRFGQDEATDPGNGTGMAGHRSGPQDGTGPQADRPLDGTGNQWGNAS
jgi:hypothetical protein